MLKASLFEDLYRKLNAEQKEAVDYLEGPVIVVAGPGTGKTHIIALRIANILKKTQANPENILALSFTNNAAYNMKNRLNKIIGTVSNRISTFTFHGFCQSVITNFPEYFPSEKKLEPIEELEQVNIIKQILKNNKFNHIKPFKSPNYYIDPIINLIDRLKKEDILPTKFTRLVKEYIADIEADQESYSSRQKKLQNLKASSKNTILRLEKSLEFSQVYSMYEKELKKRGLYDYNDEIIFVIKAFKKQDQLLGYYQEKYLYILVDEYQDTNNSQNQIIKLLTGFFENPNLFVVGDDEQSIYRFQGAAIENILEFKHKYKNAKIIVLRQNYRSTKNILDGARTLISKNQNQLTKNWDIEKSFFNLEKNQNLKIKLGEFNSGDTENYFIISKIKQKISKKIPLDEIAIIARKHQNLLTLKHILEIYNIPYIEERSENILEDFQINRLFKMLSVIAEWGKNDGAKISEYLFQVMHYPWFKINSKDIWTLNTYAYEKKISLKHLLMNRSSSSYPKLINKKAISNFVDLLNKLFTNRYNIPVTEYFVDILHQTQYFEWILQNPSGQIIISKLNKLYDQIKLKNRKIKNFTLENFLEYIDELEENNLRLSKENLNPDICAIKLLTAHAAKGLEFDTVFIIHATQSSWNREVNRELLAVPQNIFKNHSKLIDEEEERRLFYVALTRAKNELIISYAQKYPENIKNEMPTVFIEEISNNYFQKIDSISFNNHTDEFIVKKLSPKINQIKIKFEDYLAPIVKRLVLSPTGLNNYLMCPKYFLISNVLKMPQAKDFNMCYGTAVHSALESFFNLYKKNLSLPLEKYLIDQFEDALHREVLSREDYLRAKTIGLKNLKKYYLYKKDLWETKGPPLVTEYNFKAHNVYYKDIPITGKIDKIEIIDPIARTLRVIDYKTSSPKSINEIMGKTARADRSQLNQLVFYKLLCSYDKNFNYGTVYATNLEYLTEKNEKFIDREIIITNEQLKELGRLISEVWNKIKNLKFDHENLQESNDCLYCQNKKLDLNFLLAEKDEEDFYSFSQDT